MDTSEVKQFFDGKKVLVTGHTGFVGAWLCMTLQFFGAELIGFSWKEEKNSLYEKIKQNLKIKNYYGDLRNQEDIRKCIEESKPEIVFHLAAYGFIYECKQDPYLTFSSNVMGTVNLYEVIKEFKCIRCVVTASSDKVYKNDDIKNKLFREEDDLGGIDPYSCSKTCEDLITQSYYDTYFKVQNKSVVILRPSNIIGGGDHNDSRLIPYIINSIRNKQDIEIRNPNAIRPWQDILDATNAYLICAMKIWDTNDIQIFNIGPTEQNIQCVGDIVNILLKQVENQEKVHLNQKDTSTSIEKQYLGLRIDKIYEKLNWKPNKTLEETMYDTYQFYIKQDSDNSFYLGQMLISNYYKGTEEKEK